MPASSRYLITNVAAAAPVSVGMAEIAMADTIGMVMHNAVTAERNMQTTANAAIAVICTLIISKGASGK